MIWLATRLAFHNRVRFLVTLVGVVFSVYLTLTETALYIGMMANATSIIRHSGADLWVASKGVQNFDFAKPFRDDSARLLQNRKEILWAKPISLSWGYLTLPDGSQELVQIIGYDPKAPVGGPWQSRWKLLSLSISGISWQQQPNLQYDLPRSARPKEI